jgi:integrase/recombinase XerD
MSIASRNVRLAAEACRARPGVLPHPRGSRRPLLSPDRTRWAGRRDHALLVVAVQTGLRVSELTGLRRRDVHLGTGPHVSCTGKGRKERSTPLTRQTVAILRIFLADRAGGEDDPVFPGPRGDPLGRDAVRRLVHRHAQAAALRCRSISAKQVTPHVLRHTCAMRMLEAGLDLTTIALWLGHEDPRTTFVLLRSRSKRLVRAGLLCDGRS